MGWWAGGAENPGVGRGDSHHCMSLKMGTQTLATALQRVFSSVPVGTQRWGHKPWPQPFKGHFRVSCGLWTSREPLEWGMWCSRLSCPSPQGCPMLQGCYSTGGLGIQNPESEAQNAMKEELEQAIAASLDGAPHSLKGSGEELLLCHGRVSKGIQECLRVRIHP